MKTIIKIPVYLEITHPDGIDRSKVTKAVSEILVPVLYDHISSQKYSSFNLGKAHQHAGIKFEVKHLTEGEIRLKLGIKDEKS